MRDVIRRILALLLLAAAAGCAQKEKEQVFEVRGVVLGPVENGEILIEHEEIPGFMPAMTMPFYVADPLSPDVASLRAGDQVSFTFRVGEQSRASNFRRFGRLPPSGPPRALADRSSARVRPGDRVPDFALVDQSGQPLTAQDLSGQYTILTFIFTRCPVPEFCPWLASRFQELQTTLAEADDLPSTQLLSVTIDPEFDTPEVLQAYGEHHGADFQRWRLATGSTESVQTLRQAFAVHVETNNASLDHTLATALVGPDRRVIEIWRGNGWKTAAVVESLRRHAAGGKGS